MSATNFVCDQAIFTSVRTPMGEGYRIIASSKGIKPNEKQAITRSSPSHDSLCADESQSESAYAIACYALPTKRICLAYSCFAGAEHTGRGGQRVYTLNLVFNEEDFANIRYNPFHLARTLMAAGCTVPQLKPPKILPELQLSVATEVDPAAMPSTMGLLDPSCLEHILQKVIALKKKNLIVNTNHGWVESAEALLLGVPGPMRSKVSFCAGLKFSVGRPHLLQLLYDENAVAKKRMSAQQNVYIDCQYELSEEIAESAWSSFVRRHWQCDDLAGLSRRTSRPFKKSTPDYCEYLGTMYNNVVSLLDCDTMRILETVSTHLIQKITDEMELQITNEMIQCALNTLENRFVSPDWLEIQLYWPHIVTIWKKSELGATFAHPLIVQLLHPKTGLDTISAAEAVVALVDKVPAWVDRNEHDAMIDHALIRTCDWLEQSAESIASEGNTFNAHQLGMVQEIVKNLRAVRKGCPIVDRMTIACEALEEKIAATSM